MQVHLPFYHIEKVAAPLAYNMESLSIKPMCYRDKNLIWHRHSFYCT